MHITVYSVHSSVPNGSLSRRPQIGQIYLAPGRYPRDKRRTQPPFPSLAESSKRCRCRTTRPWCHFLSWNPQNNSFSKKVIFQNSSLLLILTWDSFPRIQSLARYRLPPSPTRSLRCHARRWGRSSVPQWHQRWLRCRHHPEYQGQIILQFSVKFLARQQLYGSPQGVSISPDKMQGWGRPTLAAETRTSRDGSRARWGRTILHFQDWKKRTYGQDSQS